MRSLVRPKAAMCALAISAAVAGLTVFVATGSVEARGPSLLAHAAGEAQYRNIRVTAATAAVKQGIKLAYVYGQTTVQAGQFFIGNLKCPAKFPHPISGGLDSDSTNTFLVTSRPSPLDVSAQAADRWAIGETNTDTKAHGVTVWWCARSSREAAIEVSRAGRLRCGLTRKTSGPGHARRPHQSAAIMRTRETRRHQKQYATRSRIPHNPEVEIMDRCRTLPRCISRRVRYPPRRLRRADRSQRRRRATAVFTEHLGRRVPQPQVPGSKPERDVVSSRALRRAALAARAEAEQAEYVCAFYAASVPGGMRCRRGPGFPNPGPRHTPVHSHSTHSSWHHVSPLGCVWHLYSVLVHLHTRDFRLPGPAPTVCRLVRHHDEVGAQTNGGGSGWQNLG